MQDNTIAEMQKQLDELGIEQPTLEEDKTLDASLQEDDNLDRGDLDLDKKPEEEDKTASKEQEAPSDVPEKENIAKLEYQKRAERRNQKIKSLEEKVSGVESTLNKIVSLLEKGKANEAEDKFKSYAEKHNLDVEGVKELAGLIKEEVGIKNEQPTTEDKQSFDEAEQKEIFEREWDELLPKLAEQYPNATIIQVKEAQKLMDEISHSSPQLAEYELEDILNSPRYSQKFKDILFSPKKKTFDSGRTSERGKLDENIDFENMNIDTPEKAIKAKELLYKATGGDGAVMFDGVGDRHTI